jgi:hypothetical protein
MTFGPGTIYGDEGSAAETSYYILTYLGLAFCVAIIAIWIVYENRRLLGHAARLSLRSLTPGGSGPGADVLPPRSDTTTKEN